MASRSLPKRVAIAAAAFGATAAVGVAPAIAAQPGQNIYGSGSSLQKIAQQNVFSPDFTSTPADHPTLTNSPTVTYFSSSSGHGLAEFGNADANGDPGSGGTLDPTQDTNANAVGQLDAYVGTDDPPTGPVTSSGTNLFEAHAAAGGSVDEVTVPVAQAPVAVLFSLPSNIKLGTGTKLNITNALLQDIWNANIPAAGGYAANSWGSLLVTAGLKKVTGTPAAQQFTDAGGSTGGAQAITLQARSSGSGTSYTFKSFLTESGDSTYPSSFDVDAVTWPVTVSTAGNSGGSQLVADTTAAPGSVGYANLADAAAGTPAYINVPTTTSGGNQILFGKIQSNEGATGTIQYASPASTTTPGSGNVYTGPKVAINTGAYSLAQTGVGHWVVPFTGGGAIDPTGSWGGTLPADPDVYKHAGSIDYYPIVAGTYDEAWSTYADASSNINNGAYGGNALAAGATVKSYLTFEVNTAQGQKKLTKSGFFYDALPSKIATYATTIVKSITP